MRKMVAIGGGGNGTTLRNGVKKPFELREIDREIVRLTEKDTPNFLFLGHAQTDLPSEQGYYNAMRETYEGVFGCHCKTIERASLAKMSKESIDALVDWADIIYESGGDTMALIELWRSTGFDGTLRQAWEQGKVLCGISAGACCWFDACSSDSLKKQRNDPTAPTVTVECLDFIQAYFTPHFNVVSEYSNRPQHMKDALKTRDLPGFGISNCAALEIVGDAYRLLTTDASNYNIQAFGLKTYYKHGQYIEEAIDRSKKWKPLNQLLAK